MLIVGLVLTTCAMAMCMWSFWVICKYKHWLGLSQAAVYSMPSLMRIFSIYQRPIDLPDDAGQSAEQGGNIPPSESSDNCSCHSLSNEYATQGLKESTAMH